MERIFITGGTGKIGREIIKSFDPSTWIFSTTRSKAVAEVKPYGNLNFVNIDITKPFHMPQSSVVIHAAGLVSFNERDRKELYDVNCIGTINTLEAAVKAGCETFVHISTAGVYEPTVIDDTCPEYYDVDGRTSNPYVQTKRFAEDLVKNEKRIKNKIIVRPATCNVYEIVEAVRKSKLYPGFPGHVSVADIEHVGSSIADCTLLKGFHIRDLHSGSIRHYDMIKMIDEKKAVKMPMWSKHLWVALMLSKDPITTPYVYKSLFKNKIYTSPSMNLSATEVIRRAIEKYGYNKIINQ